MQTDGENAYKVQELLRLACYLFLSCSLEVSCVELKISDRWLNLEIHLFERRKLGCISYL